MPDRTARSGLLGRDLLTMSIANIRMGEKMLAGFKRRIRHAVANPNFSVGAEMLDSI